MKKEVTKKVVKKKPEKVLEKKQSEFILEVKKLNDGAFLPEYMFDTDVGLDLKADENVNIYPLEQKTVKTGISIKIPEGHVGLIRDRAGIVSKMNVHTAAGTFDPAYTGEVSVVLVNLGETSVQIEKGMRIAQIVIIPVTRVLVKEKKSLEKTKRGEKGFGSTGISKEFDKLISSLKK